MPTDDAGAFDRRVLAIAERLGYSYPPLKPDELKIAQVTFEFDGEAPPVTMTLADNHHKSFLFLEDEAEGGTEFETRMILDAAMRFYGYLWDDRPGEGVHKFLDTFRKSVRIIIVYQQKD